MPSKNGERKRKLLLKNEEISGGKAYTNKMKLIRNILTITDVFLDKKSHWTHGKDDATWVFLKVPQGLEDRKGEGEKGMEGKLSEVNTRTVSSGQNELIGKFKMAAGDMMRITYTYKAQEASIIVQDKILSLIGSWTLDLYLSRLAHKPLRYPDSSTTTG